jgi:hypothetical protein
MRALCLLLSSWALLTGCRPAPRPAADCTWREEPPRALDLKDGADRRHLTGDALRAEDVAIRYADSLAAPHSRHFQGFAKYNQTRETCMTALLGAVARLHGVPSSEVRAALARRAVGPDAAVLLACAIIFILAAHAVARRVSDNFPWSGGWDSVAAVVATIGAAAAVSVLAVMMGESLAIGIEVLRVGNGHLSYRTGRIPWTQHRMALFLAGIVLFLLVAVLRQVREGGRPTVRAADTRR